MHGRGTMAILARSNFHQAHYDTILVKKGYSKWHDIPAAELGYPQDPEALFRAVHKWAREKNDNKKNRYIGAFPNFHRAHKEQGMVYGAILAYEQAAKWRDIPR